MSWIFVGGVVVAFCARKLAIERFFLILIFSGEVLLASFAFFTSANLSIFLIAYLIFFMVAILFKMFFIFYP